MKLSSLCKRYTRDLGNKIYNHQKKKSVDGLKWKMDIAEKEVSEAIYWTYPKSAEKDREMDVWKKEVRRINLKVLKVLPSIWQDI